MLARLGENNPPTGNHCYSSILAQDPSLPLISRPDTPHWHPAPIRTPGNSRRTWVPGLGVLSGQPPPIFVRIGPRFPEFSRICLISKIPFFLIRIGTQV